jgi:hypothetical protein
MNRQHRVSIFEDNFSFSILIMLLQHHISTTIICAINPQKKVFKMLRQSFRNIPRFRPRLLKPKFTFSLILVQSQKPISIEPNISLLLQIAQQISFLALEDC